MAKAENEKEAITDGGGDGNEVSVIESITDPGVFCVVVSNPDWSPV